MATTVVNPGFGDLQRLAEHAAGAGPIVSCYADVSVPPGGRPLWRQRLTSEVRRIEETLPGESAVLDAFRQDVAAIETVLSKRPAAARGLAVFAASRHNLLQAYVLPATVPDRLALDREPYLVPLLEMLHRQRRYLVVHTDTHRGRIYSAVPGSLRTLEEIDALVPKKPRNAGLREQDAPDVRRGEHVVTHYVEELVDEIARAWPAERYDGIVLLGEDDVLTRIRSLLPDDLRSRIVATAPHAWAGGQVSLLDKVDAVSAHVLREQKQQLFDEVGRRLSEHRYIAAGPQGVIDAIDSGLAGHPGCVVVESDQGQVGSHCTGCGQLYVQPIAACPACGAACETTNLCQAIALLAARKDVTLHFVEPGQGLQAYGGAVALLSHDTRWVASAAPVMARSPGGPRD